VAVVTGRPRSDAERFLADHGLTDTVATVVCMEDAPAKPDPAPVRLALDRLGVRTAWMVGDTVDDLRSARAARVLPIGVPAPGDDPAAAAATLRSAGAARILGSVTDLLEVLR
jgi:phosphoglycolate phosphatase-like HAD superfamily hydrolase